MISAVLYARYSSDKQSPRSCEDQLRLCRAHAEGLGATVVAEFSDAAVSGSEGQRPSLDALLRRVAAGGVQLVIAEALDRLSRDLGHLSGLQKRLGFAGAEIDTIAEGRVSWLHVGLRGTMNQLYLVDLAAKTRRGLEGVFADGRIPGGLCYGYRTVEGQPGVRTIDPDQAARVVEIFERYAAGVSAREIAKHLNTAGVRTARGGTWKANAIITSVLRNEIYRGEFVWNRTEWLKDPESGKRVKRDRPPEQWKRRAAPELRIVSDDVWQACQARLDKTANTHKLNERNRPKHLLSGLVFCDVCGGPCTNSTRDRVGCRTAREEGICTNNRTLAWGEIERRVLAGLKARMLSADAVQIYAERYVEHYRQERKKHAAGRGQAARRLGEVQARLARLVNSIEVGKASRSVGARVEELEAEEEVLEREIARADREDADVVPLHPGLAEKWRRQVEDLEAALADPGAADRPTESALAATRELIRGMTAKIVMVPGEKRGQAELVVHGRLAALMEMARLTEETGHSVSTAVVVAGARNEHDSTLPTLRFVA